MASVPSLPMVPLRVFAVPLLHDLDPGATTTPAWLLTGLAPLFGAAIGSFLNVVVYRVPAGLSIVRPASHCPKCATPIRSTDNVPVLGWLLLRGRCRACQQPISARYPLVEFVTAEVFFVLAWRVWLDEGANLPASLELVQRYGMFAYHALLLCGLLSIALIEYDGNAVQNGSALLGLIGIAAGTLWPWLHPVSPPFIGLQERLVAPPQAIGLLDGLAGWLVGVVFGCLASPLTVFGPSGAAGRNTALLSLVATGAFLGWQATAGVASVCALLLCTAILFQAAWPALRRVTFTGLLFVVTLVWLVAWNDWVSWLPRLGQLADHWTLGIAGGLTIVAAALVWSVRGSQEGV